MLPTTNTYKQTISTSHQAITKGEIRDSSGNLLLTLSMSAGIDQGGAKLSAGSVVVDAENNVRRTANVTFLTDPNSTLVPATYSSILSPMSGNEIWLYRGIQYPNPIQLLDGNVSNQEFVPLGVFRILDMDAKQTNDGVDVTLKGDDRSNWISRNTWQAPYQLTAGAELSVALRSMLTFLYPACQFNFTPTPYTISNIVFGTTKGGDPWADAVNLANLCGQDLYFDAYGYCVLKPLPNLSSAVPITTQIQGTQGFTIVDATRSSSNKDVFNNVILDVQPADGTAPYKIIAADLNPSSPTWIGGNFGTVTKIIQTSVPTSKAQAVANAQALLNQYIGSQDTHTYSMVCDPSLDAYDVLQVLIPGLSTNSNLIIDSLSIPLGLTDTETIVCRTIIARNTVST